MPPSSAFRGETTLITIQAIDQLTTGIHELFQQAFDLYHDSRHAIVASERENAGLQLRGLSHTLQQNIAEHHKDAARLSVTDVAEAYVVAGYTKDEAVVKAKEDLAGLSGSISTVERMVGQIVAEVVYNPS